MSIPNVATLYQKIAKGAEGGLEFARIIKMLLQAENDIKGTNLIAESDASGDYMGLDAYIPGDKDFPLHTIGFQFKFYPAKLNSKQKQEIDKSISNALTGNKFIQQYILITPEDFMKEQLVWFNVLKKKYENTYWADSNGLYRKSGLKLIHWGHTKIIELVLKHGHIGNKYYPELFPFKLGEFGMAQASIDCKSSFWSKSENYYYSQLYPENEKLTPDPVFDFQFSIH